MFTLLPILLLLLLLLLPTTTAAAAAAAAAKTTTASHQVTLARLIKYENATFSRSVHTGWTNFRGEHHPTHSSDGR